MQQNAVGAADQMLLKLLAVLLGVQVPQQNVAGIGDSDTTSVRDDANQDEDNKLNEDEFNSKEEEIFCSIGRKATR